MQHPQAVKPRSTAKKSVISHQTYMRLPSLLLLVLQYASICMLQLALVDEQFYSVSPKLAITGLFSRNTPELSTASSAC